MSNQTQQQIDTLIQIINDAEEPGTVTNLIVAAVLAFLADKIKTMATASALDSEVSALEAVDASLNQAIQNEATARQAADTTLSDRISALQVALDRLMSGNVSETIESFNEVINFLNEVTDDETLTGLLSQINNRIASVEDDLAAKADLNRYTNKLAYGHAPDVVLATMGDALDNVNNSGATNHYVPVAGDTYWDSTSRTIKYIDVGGTTRDLEAPKGGLVYCNKRTDLTYRWDATTGWKQVGGGPGGASDFVNNLYSNATDKALAAAQGAVLKTQISYVYSKLQALFSDLGSAAFWGSKKQLNAFLPDLDWGSTKHTVTINNSNANLVIKRNGEPAGSSFQIDEGASVTLSFEGASGYRLTSLSVNGVNLTINNDSASYTFTVNTDVTLTIASTTAVIPNPITVNITRNGCTVSDETSNPCIGGTYSVKLTPPEGGSITSVVANMEGGGSLSRTNNQDGSVTISTQNVTGNITIIVSVVSVMVKEEAYTDNGAVISNSICQRNTNFISLRVDGTIVTKLLYVFGAENTQVKTGIGMVFYSSEDEEEYVIFLSAFNRCGYRIVTQGSGASGTATYPATAEFVRATFLQSTDYPVRVRNSGPSAGNNYGENDNNHEDYGPVYSPGIYGWVNNEWRLLFDASPYFDD